MATRKSPPGMAMAGCMAIPDAANVSQLMSPQLHLAEKLIAQNIEILDFLRTRFERDQEMVRELADQGDPLKAMTLWGEFWQRTLTDYSTEMAKLATSVSGIAEQAVRTATEEGEVIAKAGSSKGGAKKAQPGVSLTDVPV